MFERTSPHKGLCLIISGKFPAQLWAQEKKRKEKGKIKNSKVPWDTLSKIALQIQRQMRGLCLCVMWGHDTKSCKGEEKNRKHSQHLRVCPRQSYPWGSLATAYWEHWLQSQTISLKKWQWPLHPGYLTFICSAWLVGWFIPHPCPQTMHIILFSIYIILYSV